MRKAEQFSSEELGVLDDVLPVAEESVAGFYKMSMSQWARLRFDVRTDADLSGAERVAGPYAQVVRYEGVPWHRSTAAAGFTHYRVCLQDPAILAAIRSNRSFFLSGFLLYILVHELVHIVRFSKHLQGFEVSAAERAEEEVRVCAVSEAIVSKIRMLGVDPICEHFRRFCGLIR